MKIFLFFIGVIFFFTSCASWEKSGFITSKEVVKIADDTPLAVGRPSGQSYFVKTYKVNWENFFKQKEGKPFKGKKFKPKNKKGPWDMTKDREAPSRFIQNQKFFSSLYKIQEEEMGKRFQDPEPYSSRSELYYDLIGREAIKESNKKLRENIPKKKIDLFKKTDTWGPFVPESVKKKK